MTYFGSQYFTISDTCCTAGKVICPIRLKWREIRNTACINKISRLGFSHDRSNFPPSLARLLTHCVLQITRDGNNCMERWRSGNSLLAIFLPQIFPPLVNSSADILQAGCGFLPEDVGPGLLLEQSGGGQRRPHGTVADQVVGRQRSTLLRYCIQHLFVGGAESLVWRRVAGLWWLVDADGLKGHSWFRVTQRGATAPVLSWERLFALGQGVVLQRLSVHRARFCREAAVPVVVERVGLQTSWDLVNDPVVCCGGWGAAVWGLAVQWSPRPHCRINLSTDVCGGKTVVLLRRHSFRWRARCLRGERLLSWGVISRSKAIQGNQKCLQGSKHSLLTHKNITSGSLHSPTVLLSVHVNRTLSWRRTWVLSGVRFTSTEDGETVTLSVRMG